jgi:hypothetical protein
MSAGPLYHWLRLRLALHSLCLYGYGERDDAAVLRADLKGYRAKLNRAEGAVCRALDVLLGRAEP